MLKRLKNKFSRIFSNYQELKELEKYLRGIKGLYNFSASDLELYKSEINTKLELKKSTLVNNLLNRISIGKNEISWPSNISDADLPWLYHEIFDPFENNPSSYDHPKMEYEKANWIIDAGCCEGYFSLFAFNKNPTCKLIALEPLREMELALFDTFNNQIQEKRFFLETKALGNHEGQVKFQYNSKHLCDSRGSNESKISDENTVYDVNVVTLDKIADQYNLQKGGVIKMDIEGAEMDALIGAEELMKNLKPRLAIAVYHEYENALKCRDIILKANPEYTIQLRGMYGYYKPPRPYILFAW